MIKAKQLSYAVRDKALLSDISLTLHTGEITAIMGPNGAGKSTLLRCLSGAISPSSGHIYLDDQLLSQYSAKELAKKRAMLRQSSTITFPFTTWDIVMMGRHPYQGEVSTTEDQKCAEEALRYVDGLHLKNRLFPTLSGGEQQRVQLARVIAQLWQQKQSYLFLDEPSSALDLKHQHQLFDVLHELKTNWQLGICIILHDIHLAKRYTDQTILLKQGSIYKNGPTKTKLSKKHIAHLFDVDERFI